MTNRYADDIKRIVGIDPNRSELETREGKSSIAGKRGIGYINKVSGGAVGLPGTAGTTQLDPDLGNGDVRDAENKAGEKASDPNDPQNGVTSPTTNLPSVEDIIDGIDLASKANMPQITQSGSQYLNNDGLNGINAKDCDTGLDMNIRLRNDFVPPTGWTDANTPPDATGWVLGEYYLIPQDSSGTGITLPATTGPTIQIVANDYVDILNSFVSARAPWTFFSITDLGGGSYQVRYKDKNGITVFFGASLEDCSTTPPADYDYSCPIAAPKEQYWPSDNTISFKYEDSKFKTSSYDGDVPPKWSGNQSKLDFCFGTGRTGTIETMKNGGVAIYETSGGAPTGLIRVYDSAGQLIAAGDNTTNWLGAYRP